MSVSHYRVTNFILLALAIVGIFISGNGYFMHLFRIKKFTDIDPILGMPTKILQIYATLWFCVKAYVTICG